MPNLPEDIKRINQKLQQLLKLYHHVQKENEQLKSALKATKIQADNDQLRINQLEQQVGILKSAAGSMNEKDKKQFEKHIDQYIREINKCIGILSE